MGNDIEQARESNMEEDKASSPNKGKSIDVGNVSDIEKAKDILEKLDTEVRLNFLQQNGSESRRSECCIYRVPKLLRNENSNAYDPLMISIGPLHRENKRLEAMEKKKLKYFKNLTERHGMDEKKMCDILIHIKNQEERLRHCYSEKSILLESSDDFVKMILLDAVFIIQFLLELNDDEGPKNSEPRMAFNITEDLMLLENQLPLFIIQVIYDQLNLRSQDAKAIPFLDLATCHFRKYPFLKRVETSPCVKGSKHFTDLLRNLMLNTTRTRGNYILKPTMPKCAVMLRKAGVRFQATRDKCLVNIKFDKGVLKIPQLKVDDNFERRIRNIMAMEQCLYEREAYICSYIKFIKHLIDSTKDVDLLVRKGIIVHELGDDAAVSDMFIGLCENIGGSYTCFGDISQELNSHCDNPFNRALVYLPTLRSAATILLILTFIQTIISVKSLF